MIKLEIKLDEAQCQEFETDKYIDISIGNFGIFLEIDTDATGNLVPSYFEIRAKKKGVSFKPVAHSVKDLRKLEPQRPDDPSWYHNDPLCPSCHSYMLYHYEHCPKCGQKLDWSIPT